MSCSNIILDYTNLVNECNLELIKNLVDKNTFYENACDQVNLQYDSYYENMKEKYEKIINNLIKSNECSKNLNFIKEIKKFFNPLNKKDLFDTSLLNNSNDTFIFDKNLNITIKQIINIILNNCNCHLNSLIILLLNKYKKKILNNTKKDVTEKKQIFFTYYSNIINKLKNYSQALKQIKNIKILNFSIENELENLIPNDIGEMKYFFINVISTYYNNLHPVVWIQIMKELLDNIFIELPFTSNEIFSYISKYLLLNSGPFILKLLQMIRPYLSDKTAKKYNLFNLTYPKLKKNEVDYILQNILVDPHMIKITTNYSASVGHICFAHNVKDKKTFVIKIVKPLSIVQSCWEYSILYKIYPKDSCERNFIINTLKSNGLEMNVQNEIKNINECYNLYTTTYQTEFSLDSSAKLTTIQHLEGVIKEDNWFSLAMTLAPGNIINKYLEVNGIFNKNTKLRANLHRCVDLLIVKFFYVLISKGIYHGDLHAGNIFYSYEQNQITLIDFGAVGNLDLFSNNNIEILKIIIMSTYYNYDEILDLLTDIMNNKCNNNNSLDKNSNEYKVFKNKLFNYKIENIKNSKLEIKKYNNIISKIFSQQVIDKEKIDIKDIKEIKEEIKEPSIYDTIEIKENQVDKIFEDNNILPDINEENNISFNYFDNVMEEIIKFFAMNNINIAIKFSELNEFQKAYSLILGVLKKINYNSYRTAKSIQKAILTYKNLNKLTNVKSIIYLLQILIKERNKFKELEKKYNTDNFDTYKNDNDLDYIYADFLDELN